MKFFADVKHQEIKGLVTVSRKMLNGLEIQQVYDRVTSFLKLQILMFSLQAHMTKYNGDEKCFSNQESESTMMPYSQVSNFALSKTCI